MVLQQQMIAEYVVVIIHHVLIAQAHQMVVQLKMNAVYVVVMVHHVLLYLVLIYQQVIILYT